MVPPRPSGHARGFIYANEGSSGPTRVAHGYHGRG
jgi:hypothetical protein